MSLTLTELVDAYTALPAPFTKRRAVQIIVRSRLSQSCTYFHRASVQGKGGKAARRAKNLSTVVSCFNRPTSRGSDRGGQTKLNSARAHVEVGDNTLR